MTVIKKAQAALNRLRPDSLGEVDQAIPKTPPPVQSQDVKPSETLVDVLALIRQALVLDNGAFIRMLEVAPVDLERFDPGVKKYYWSMFTAALRRLPAPLTIQLVITTQPQDIQPYITRWQTVAQEWQTLAEEPGTSEADAERRRSMAQRAIGTAAFLAAAHERLAPMQQRYLVVITHNPFMNLLTAKTPKQVLEPKVVDAALEKLEESVSMVRAALGDIGLPIYELDPAAMCQALWDHNHHPPSLLGGDLRAQTVLDQDWLTERQGPVNQCPSADDFLKASRDPARLADLLAPALVEIQDRHLRVGECLARGYILYDFNTQAPVDFASLLSFQADMTHALYLTAADPVAMRQAYRSQEVDLKAASAVDSQRGAVTDYSREAAINSTEADRAKMEAMQQAPFFLHWFCLVWANDLEALEKQCKKFETQLKVRGIRYHPATRRHIGIFQSARPVSRMAYTLTTGPERNMNAESLGSFFPFVRREYLDPAGWHFGFHRGNGMLICFDPYDGGRGNANELVIAAQRTGKSVYLKQTVETQLALGHRVFAFDPEREYLQLAVDHHAPYIELGKRREVRPLPLDPGHPDGFKEGLLDLSQKIYEPLAGKPMTRAQAKVLGPAYQVTMAQAGIFYDQPETWRQPVPSVADLNKQLRQMPGSDARELARVLGYVEALAGGNVLNIMKINLAAENPWGAAAERLAGFVEAAQSQPLDSSGFNALVRGYQITMEKWGFRADDPKTWHNQAPTLSALVDTLSGDSHPRSRDLADVLFQFSHGIYADLFNRDETVDVSQAQFVVFGMRSLRESAEKSLAPVFAWQGMGLIWNEVVANSATGQPFRLIADEGWYLLEQPGTARRLEWLIRSFPKYSAAISLATHDVHKLFSIPETRVIAELSRIKVLFKQESPSAARAIGELCKLSETEQDDLLHLGKGEGWLLLGDELHLPIYVAVNPQRLHRLSTNREQMQAIALASGRGGRPVR